VETVQAAADSEESDTNCNCSDCLCDGAIVTPMQQLADAVAETVLAVVEYHDLAGQPSSDFDRDRCDLPIRSAPTGREVVILHGNLRR